MEFALVLVAALFHAAWNLVLKRSDNGQLTFTLIRLVGAIFGVVILTFIDADMHPDAIPFLLIAAACHFAYFFCLLKAYQYGDISQVYPISRGVAPLLVLLMSTLLIADQLDTSQILGTLVVCVGILSLAFGSGTMPKAALGYSLATAVCIAGYTYASGIGVRLSGSFIAYAGWLEFTIGTCLLTFSFLMGKINRTTLKNSNLPIGILAGILSVSAYIVVLWAMSRSAIAPVAALRETSIIFAAILGGVFLKEAFNRRRVLASFIVAAGIALLGSSAF